MATTRHSLSSKNHPEALTHRRVKQRRPSKKLFRYLKFLKGLLVGFTVYGALYFLLSLYCGSSSDPCVLDTKLNHFFLFAAIAAFIVYVITALLSFFTHSKIKSQRLKMHRMLGVALLVICTVIFFALGEEYFASEFRKFHF